MSRRKQRQPRQIKRPFGEMEGGSEAPLEDSCPSEKEEGSVSDREGSGEGDSSRSPWSEKADCRENLEEPEKSPVPEIKAWTGPDELDFLTSQAESQVCAKCSIPSGASWGPFAGNIHIEPASPRHTEMASPVTLILQDDSCWLAKLCLVPGEGEANSVIYKNDDSIWCKTTKPLSKGDALKAFVMAEPVGIPSHAEKTETGEAAPTMAPPPEIQLLPQQAGMAAILATAVVNKDVFPCKDCGIWYRSERNLQAHLTYYCASRQNAASPAVEEKPKELYPNERVCPFPQCQKSCPSASSLEIHMRSHSGERPFVCLICLSAFTTKANCERHLKVHTDTLNGVCHHCGFISTTRDILYSHLVTSHMACQPGSKGEVYPPGPLLPAATTKPLAPGLSSPGSSSAFKCSFCGYVANCLTSLQQHVVLHEPPTAAAPSPELQQSQPDAPAGSPAVEEAANGSPSQEESPSTSLAEGAPPVQVKEEPLEEGAAVPATSPEPELEVSSPHSLQSVAVKSEITSPTPGSSPVPREPVPSTSGGTLFLPQYVFGHEAAGMPQASEILAKMSELVHNRLKQGHAAVPAALFPGSPVLKGATCFECEITFNNINNYYVHKRLYCSSRRLAEDGPPGPRKAKPGPAPTPKGPDPPAAGLSPQLPGDSQAGPGGDAQRGATPPAAEVKVEERAAKGSPSPETEGSQSPGSSSLEEPDDDPNRTVCDACNIRFSRHETYMVHKRFYCASRHDPPLRRPSSAGKLPFLPQPIRTRKRRKLYEIHRVATPPGSTPEPPRPEAAPVVPALISMVKASPSPSSSPDTEGPIDLSKKPRLHHGGGGLPPSLLPLADYHECTACRISFHSLSSYLAHKKYYCLATPLQPRAPELLRPSKGSPSALLKPRGSPEGLAEEPDLVSVKVEKGVLPPLGLTTTPATVASVDPLPTPYLEAKAQHLHGSKGALAICPYCPLNGAVKGDLADHFRSAHGLLAAKALAGATLVESSQAGVEGSLHPLPPAPLPRQPKDSKEVPVSPLPNSSPRPTGSPLPLPLVPSISLPEAFPRLPAQTPEYTDKGVQTTSGKGPPNPVANGSHRFCRLCNIKFSSLSTFIAHKKYYCSSHAAEHVK